MDQVSFVGLCVTDACMIHTGAFLVHQWEIKMDRMTAIIKVSSPRALRSEKRIC